MPPQHFQTLSPSMELPSDDVGVEKTKAVGLAGDDVMPKHVAVILDGNGRWAKNRGLPVTDGHKAGEMTVKRLVSSCSKFGIKVLTVFVFSTENWKRPQVEIDFLMSIIEGFIRSDVYELMKRDDIRFSVIGNRSRLPESLQSAISSAEDASGANRGMRFVVALSYGGRHEISEATRRIAKRVEDGSLRAKDVDESVLEKELMTSFTEFPNPDLLIRTGGELRVSNFMLWQLAYAELYFVDKLFPEFEESDLVEALASFQRRQRRYGERKN